MMITIHGFPAKTKYQDVKVLIKRECNINDFILDNLVNDNDGTKKVRIGLTDESEGLRLMKCLDGYRMQGNHVLKAIPVGKAAANLSQQNFDSGPGYQNQPRNDYNQSRNDYIPPDYNNQGPHSGSHGGPHGPPGPQGPGPHGMGSQGPGSRNMHGGPPGPHSQSQMDPMGRPSPWVSNNSSNQWNPNPAPVGQGPQNYGYNGPPQNMNAPYGQQQHPNQPRPPFNQGRGPGSDQGFGYQPKRNEPMGIRPPGGQWMNMGNPQMTFNMPHQPPRPYLQQTPFNTYQQFRMNYLYQASRRDGNVDFTEDDDEFDDQFITTDQSGPPFKTGEKRERFHKRVPNAAKKRMMKWMKLGKSYQEARALCETRLNRCTEYLAIRNAKKSEATRKLAAKIASQRILFGPSQESKPINITVIDDCGPMPPEKIDLLQEQVLQLIDQEGEGDGPKFLGCVPRRGGLVFNCANLQTKEWVANNVTTLKPWEEAQLRIMNPDEKPKVIIGVAFLPEPKLDQWAILSKLNAQNKGIDCSHWRVVKINQQKGGETVTFAIDPSSLSDLAEKNFRVFIGFRKVHIRLKNKEHQDMVKKIPPPLPKANNAAGPSGVSNANAGNAAVAPRKKSGTHVPQKQGQAKPGSNTQNVGNKLSRKDRKRMAQAKKLAKAANATTGLTKIEDVAPDPAELPLVKKEEPILLD